MFEIHENIFFPSEHTDTQKKPQKGNNNNKRRQSLTTKKTNTQKKVFRSLTHKKVVF